MINDICFICYDEGYVVKIPCNKCNLFIHPLCLKKLIDNLGIICKVCKSNYNISQELIMNDTISNTETSINKKIFIIKILKTFIISMIVLFENLIVVYYFIQNII